MGLCALLETQGLRVLPARATGGLGAWLGRALARLDSAPRGLRALVVGLSTTLLPCGWLYAFAVTAAGTGSVLGGVSVMAAFWLGSVPLLLAAGVGLRALSARLSRHVPVLTALLLIGVGLCLVVARINAPSLAVELLLTPDAPAAAAGQAKGCPLHGH
jgi:sulfite exporter TauE/SafE